MANGRAEADSHAAGSPADAASAPKYRLHPAWVVAGVLFVLVSAVMVGKFLHGDYKDAEVWYDAGRRVLTGDTLAGLPHYRYPPAFAVFVSPLAALGFAPFFFVWYLLNVALLGVAVWLARALVSPTGGNVSPRDYWVPALLVAAFAIDNLFLGQTNLLIMVLVYSTFLWDQQGRQWRAGIPLGAAMAIKTFPAALLAYFVFRLRARVVAGAVLCCAFFLLLLPAPVRGFGRNLQEVSGWGERVAAPFVSRGEAGDWGQHSLDFGNQSLPAVARRCLTRVDAQVMAREGPPIYVNIAQLDYGQAVLVAGAVAAALCAGFLLSVGWRRPWDPLQLAAEYGLATAVLLLLSPLSWTYFFVMLLLPVALGLRFLSERERLRGRSVLSLRAALWGLALATILLVSHYARALGNMFWATLLFYIALALACLDLRQSRSEPPSRASAHTLP